MSNTWGRSDVQKELTLSWGASSSSPSETYASSSAPSNSITPTVKPIWYGIDGQPAKDQSNGVSKRVGLIQSPVPFGTRIRKTNGRSTTKHDEFTISPMKSSSYKSTTPNMGIKENNVDWPSPTTGSWQKIDDSTDSFKTENRLTWNNDVDYDYATTKTWTKDEDIPETSINPTGIQGVWEQQSRKDIDFETSINPTRIKGVWEQQSTKRMDPETSINPTGVKGVWEQQITKRIDPETSIHPSGVQGVWEQQITKRMDSESFINPTRTKRTWKQQSTRKFNEDHPFSTNMLKNKDFDNKPARTVQNGRNFKTTSNQRKEWNQRRKFRKVQSSTSANRGWVLNSSQKQKALENSTINTIIRHQN